MAPTTLKVSWPQNTVCSAWRCHLQSRRQPRGQDGIGRGDPSPHIFYDLSSVWCASGMGWSGAGAEVGARALGSAVWNSWDQGRRNGPNAKGDSAAAVAVRSLSPCTTLARPESAHFSLSHGKRERAPRHKREKVGEDEKRGIRELLLLLMDGGGVRREKL